MSNINEYIKPQLVVILSENEIKKIYLLSLFDDYEESKAYKYYKSNFSKKIEVIKSHILLTLNIKYIKVFLNTLFDIDYTYILYSPESNVEYIKEKDIFNPNYDNPLQYFENNEPLYKIYASCASGIILFLMPYDMDYEIEVDNNLKNFIESMFVSSLELKIDFNFVKDNIFLITLDNSEMLKIIKEFNMDNFYITYYYKNGDTILTSGSNITFYSEIDITEKGTLIITNTKNKIIMYNDKYKIFCDDLEVLKTILNIINKYDVERLNSKITYKFFLNCYINPNESIIDEFQHVLLYTKSKNIYTLDNNVLMFTKNSIIMKLKENIYNFPHYICSIIIYYQKYRNRLKLKMSKIHKKIGTAYLSRICQENNNLERKTIEYVLEENLEILDDMERIKDKFYMNDHKEVYIEDNNIIHLCSVKTNGGRMYIGFIEKFYELNNLCIPCCYKFSKVKDNVFQSCIDGKEYVQESRINPYILNFGKVLIRGRISFLPKLLDKIFNVGSQIALVNKRIDSAVNYYTVIQDQNKIVSNKQDIAKELSNNCIILNKNSIYVPYIYRYVDDIDFSSNVSIKIIIQDIIHKIVKINKKKELDEIDIDQNNSDLHIILKKYISDTNKKSIEEGDLLLNEKGFYIKGKKVTERIHTKYLIKYNKINNITLNANLDNFVVEDNKQFEELYFLNNYIFYK